MANEITMYRGDTNTITVAVTDSDGAAYDLTDYTMRFTVKNNSTDEDADAVIGPKTATIASPTTGIGVVAITKTESDLDDKVYVYDVQITSATDNYTIIKSSFTIINDITLVTS